MRLPSAAAGGDVASHTIKVVVRSSRGDGSFSYTVDAPASCTVASFKQLLCHPPHSVCSNTSILVLVMKGSVLQDDITLASAALTVESSMTVIILVAGSHLHAQQNPTSTSLVSHAHQVHNAPCSPSISTTHLPAPDAAIKEGTRVRIENLIAKPELNGRTGVVCGTFIQTSGRFRINVDADGAKPAFVGSFRPSNLRALPSHDSSTQWLDEDGRAWPKNVDFSRECSKGHTLVLLGDCGEIIGDDIIICRLCLSLCERKSEEAANWLFCSFDVSCCGGYAVCCICARAPGDAAVVSEGCDDVQTLGVGIPYLQWLRSTLGSSLGRCTTSQFCQMYVRPFTSRSRGSVMEQLMVRSDTAQFVGEATWFISHTWSNVFTDTLDAVLLFFEGREDASNAHVWWDVIMTSQHENTGPRKPSSWWMGTFKESIARIGGLLLVVDVWDNPSALKRAWCVLELHAIACKKKDGDGRFAIAMTAQEHRRFLTGTMQDCQQYYSMLGRVNAETSDCSRPADRESIHEGIRRSVGFAELSRMVFAVMEGWMEEQLRSQVAVSAEAGNEYNLMRWNSALATLLMQQGRSDEAVVIFEACMDYCQRKLPEHDYIRGFMMNSLAQSYAKLGRNQDALVMFEKTLECLGHVLPENHPELGAAMSSLAATHHALGRFHDALFLHEKALEFRRRILPENHLDIIESMNNLALTYCALGRHRDALVLQEEVLRCLRHVLPENHPNFGDSMHNLAATYHALGRLHDAVLWQEKSLEFRRRVLPASHPSLGESMNNLAVIYLALGRLNDALALQEKTLEIQRLAMPGNQPSTGVLCLNISETLNQMGDSRRSFERAREAMLILQACLPASHPYVQRAREQVRSISSRLNRRE